MQLWFARGSEVSIREQLVTCFGAGAALGASASGDQTARGRVAGGLIGGTLCALIGGAIGRSFSLDTSHNYHDWDDAQD